MYYSRQQHAYIDGERAVAESEIIAHVDVFKEELSARLRPLIEAYRSANGERAALERKIRRIIKDSHILSYSVGRGGRSSMTQSDWGKVGYYLRGQYRYLTHFLSEIGTLSEAQAAARADLYLEAASASYYRGRSADYGVSLPAYPGDGTTQCMARCKCSWQFRQDETGTYAFWTLGFAEHCADCVMRSQLWSPYAT